MHQSWTISIPSSWRRNMCWMSAKSNVILKICGLLSPNTSGWCRAYMVLSPTLHALLYQLWNLCIKGGQSVSAQSGSKSFPYSNFIGASSKFWKSSTPMYILCSVSVRGVEKPDHLLALEFAGLSLDLAFSLDFKFVACHLLTISHPSLSFW